MRQGLRLVALSAAQATGEQRYRRLHANARITGRDIGPPPPCKTVIAAVKDADDAITDYVDQQQYTTAQQHADDAFVYLYRSLGGGWEHYQNLPPIHHPLPAVAAAFTRVAAREDRQRQPR